MTDVITFAIGDVHGCSQKLERLIATCERVSARRQSRFILIGDYVDRGPDAKGGIDFLMKEQVRQPYRFVCLRGNHEQMLLAAAAAERSDSDLVNWWANGGEQTLESYGVNDPSELPDDHLAWIRALPLKLTDGKRLYVHAGIRPGVAMAAQTAHDLLWIREPFLSSDLDHGALVVHGHTPTKSGLPDLRTNRLNIDTGACFGGQLTAAMFSNRQRQPMMFVNDLGGTWS
ncbi:metallophosphoesterase family protein [Bradyrhizobium sp. WSM2254]|uniref:metallophosphoesterase family protein n=1 Tax=Bradyrhizobium sp. WSM2254 TaxID=1188263 RepID=UPI000485C33A|nr:metallophosphoesterase family protein [Bradyrhizobium sp. WSM2254]